MRLLTLRLRTLMISIAFLALTLTVIMQAILLQRAAVREEQLRAEGRFQRAGAILKMVQAEAALSRGRWPSWRSSDRRLLLLLNRNR